MWLPVKYSVSMSKMYYVLNRSYNNKIFFFNVIWTQRAANDALVHCGYKVGHKKCN